jgi:hypothetical protein
MENTRSKKEMKKEWQIQVVRLVTMNGNHIRKVFRVTSPEGSKVTMLERMGKKAVIEMAKRMIAEGRSN